ncbi:hypothetical protein [Thiocapsa sp. N5-Cardenillas]|uniref:hypothetical protein n=1 Tax=Thiocapsa sp. N5-Cardenillas TaxID=3137397 RepID=UPI0035B15EDE
MFVKDILPDLPQAIGGCTNDYAMRRLTDAVELLVTEGLIDTQVEEIALCACGSFVTLPREVGTPLAITVDGSPSLIRDEWFTYHINGPGDTNWTPVGFADVLGQSYPTIREPDRPVRLAAVIRTASDSNKVLRVFGYDENGERILSPNADGTMTDGFLVPTVFNRVLMNADVSPIVRIERVTKERTQDMVDLIAVDPDTGTAISVLGRYRPSETTPAYTRIRVSGAEFVRLKFKRRSMELSDDYDWIPVDHREALIHAVRAVKYRLDGKYEIARAAEQEAVRLLRKQTTSKRPAGIKPPQVINNDHMQGAAGSSMFYG